MSNTDTPQNQALITKIADIIKLLSVEKITITDELLSQKISLFIDEVRSDIFKGKDALGSITQGTESKDYQKCVAYFVLSKLSQSSGTGNSDQNIKRKKDGDIELEYFSSGAQKKQSLYTYYQDEYRKLLRRHQGSSGIIMQCSSSSGYNNF